MSVLTAVKNLLETPGKVEDLHREMTNNPLAYEFMHQCGLFPGHNDLRNYFVWLKRGLAYAFEYWGEIALPKQLVLLHKPPRDNEDYPFYIGYTFQRDDPKEGDDKMSISFAKIAHDCIAQQKGELVNDKHLSGIYFQPADWVTLQAIEECNHCKEIRGGFPTHPNVREPVAISHPMELKIASVFRTAIKRLRIQCYRRQQQQSQFEQTIAEAKRLLGGR